MRIASVRGFVFGMHVLYQHVPSWDPDVRDQVLHHSAYMFAYMYEMCRPTCKATLFFSHITRCGRMLSAIYVHY